MLRGILALLIASSSLVSATARAGDPCKSQCDEQNAACLKDCAGDADCPEQCSERKKICPQMCAAIKRGGADPNKIMKEMQKAAAEIEIQREKEQAAKDKASGHHH